MIMLRILRNIQGLKNSVNDILKLMIFQRLLGADILIRPYDDILNHPRHSHER